MTTKKIGNEVIYPYGISLGEKVLKEIWSNEDSNNLHKRCPIGIGQPQVGKTGAETYIVEALVQDCIKRKRKFQVILIVALSHLDLTEQTDKRFCINRDGDNYSGAEINKLIVDSRLARYPTRQQESAGILILNNSPTLRTVNLNLDEVDVRFILIDEVHLGNIKGGNIDVFLKNHGVDISQQIHAWKNSKTINHVIGVSATPSAHLIKSNKVCHSDEKTFFTALYEDPPEQYTSMEDLLNKDRLRQTHSLFAAKGKATHFLEQILKEFQQNCSESGPGYLVIRAKGKQHSALLSYIGFLNANGQPTEFKEFDAEKDNIKELNKYLEQKPVVPTIVIIKGSMRAGITLPSINYIKGWVENPSGKAGGSDAPVQSGVGRSCGYNRENDSYPIYCAINHVKEYIKLYNDLSNQVTITAVPAGGQNRQWNGNPPRKDYAVRYITKEEKEKEFPNANHGFQFSTTLGNMKNDIAAKILNRRSDSTSTKGYYINGPTSRTAYFKYLKNQQKQNPHYDTTLADILYDIHQESYRELLRINPGVEWKYAILDKLSPTSTAPSDSKLKPSCSLKGA